MKHLVSAFACLCLWSTAAAAANPPPIEAYTQLPATEFVTLSPSGERIALLTGAGDKRRVVIRTTDGKVLQATAVGDAKVRNLQWAGDDHLIVETSITTLRGLYVPGEWYAGEVFEASVLNVKTKTALLIFYHSRTLFPIVLSSAGYREIDGHWYGYFSGATMPDTDFSSTRGTFGPVSLYQVDLDTGVYSLAGEGNKNWVVGGDGIPLVHAVIRRDKGVNQWQLYAGRFERDLIEQQDAATDLPRLMGLGRTAGTYLIERPSGSEVGLWERSMTPGQAPVNLTHASFRSLLHDSDGHLIGAELEGDAPIPELFNPTFKATFEAVKQAFAPARVDPVSFNATGKRLIVRSSSTTDAGTYYLVDLTSQNVEKIGAIYPDLQDGTIGEARVVHYRAADGMALEGILTLPPGAPAKNLPLVVLPHGGPEARDHLGFDWMAQVFAARGYEVFQPNFRGSGGFNTAFRDAGFGEWGRKMQTDISDGVADLARQGMIDPRRVAIVGVSYGGYAALAGITVQHGLYRCAVSYGGVSDLLDMLEWSSSRSGKESVGTQYWRRYMGAKSNTDSSLQAYSPIALAAAADAPVLLVYGADDTVVPPRQSQTMAKALGAAGKQVELIELKDEDHWLSRPASRTQMFKAAVDFVEKYNPPTLTQ